MLLLQLGALILGGAVVCLIFVLDRPEDLGSVSEGWMRRRKQEEIR